VEILLAFAIGYVVGARAGETGWADVVDAAKALRQSDEFRALLDALRSHAAATLRALADVIGDRVEPVTAEGLVERVLTLVNSGDRDRPTSTSS
jgi:hypothetical protein